MPPNTVSLKTSLSSRSRCSAGVSGCAGSPPNQLLGDRSFDPVLAQPDTVKATARTNVADRMRRIAIPLKARSPHHQVIMGWPDANRR